MIHIQNLEVAYTSTPVLKDINLHIKTGETLGLIGLNGVGKTTLIKTMLGLRQPDKGQIIYEEELTSDKLSEGFKNRVAYLPERFEPPIFLRGEEFIRFSASLYKKTLKKEEIDAAAVQLELDPSVLKRSVNTYSKGMRQKLGLIATSLTGCHFLILDEPMSGLDPKARVCVKEKIKSMQKEGRTIFLSSHILADMNEICDRVAVIHASRLQFTGAPEELLQKYSTQTLERGFLKLIDEHEMAA
jgi:ABC-2 type transport system ATP-binding protein